MDETFGRVLREARKKSGKTMAQVADFLGITVSYVSDIERAQRAPWAQDRLVSLAGYLGVDSRTFVAAAARARGALEFDTAKMTDRHLRLAAALNRRFTQLSDTQLEDLERMLEEEKAS